MCVTIVMLSAVSCQSKSGQRFNNKLVRMSQTIDSLNSALMTAKKVQKTDMLIQAESIERTYLEWLVTKTIEKDLLESSSLFVVAIKDSIAVRISNKDVYCLDKDLERYILAD